jgi:SdrD B-like domain
MSIGLSKIHHWNLPSLLCCSIFLFLLLKHGESSKWEHIDGESGPLEKNLFKVIDSKSKNGYWNISLKTFYVQKAPEHGDSSMLMNQSFFDDRIDENGDARVLMDNLSFPNERGTNNDVSQIQHDSSEKGVYDEVNQKELRDDQSDSVNNKGSVLISNHFVRRTTGTEINKYGFETEVVKIEQSVTFGLTKTGGRHNIDQGNAESLSKYFLSKITGQSFSEEQLDDSRIEIGRASKPRRKAVSRLEPDLDPKTIFKCRCEYPNEGIYIKMNKSGNSNGSGKFRRVLSTGKNRSFFRRPTLSRKKIFYRNTWDVDQYAVVNGTSILPPWHAACNDVVFICSRQSMNNCSLWEHHCTTDDFPMHRHKSSTAKLNNGKRNLQSSIHSKHLELTTYQAKSAKSSRRKLGTCKSIVLPNDNPFCLGNKTTRSYDTISHQKVPTEKHDSNLKDSINFSPPNPDLSKNSDSVATSPSQRPPTRMPSKRKRPIPSLTPHIFKPRPKKTQPPTKAPNRNVISTLPPTKQPTRRVSKDDPLKSTVAINSESPTSQRDRDATPQLLDTQNESMTSGKETLTPTKLPTPRLHSTDFAELSASKTSLPSIQISFPPTKVPTPRASPESSFFSDSTIVATSTAKEVTRLSTSPSTRPHHVSATVPTDRCDGYDLSACLVSGKPNNLVSSVEKCSSHSNECGASSRNIMVSLLTTGFDPSNQETFLIYNVSLSETASVDRVTFSWTGDCCIRDASFSGSKVSYGLDTKTCSYGVMFGDVLSGSHDLYKIVFAGNIPIQGSSMHVKALINDTVCKFTVPGPDCSLCVSDIEQNNKTIPAFIMTDSPTIHLSPSTIPQGPFESSLPSLLPSVAPSGSATPSAYPSVEGIVPHGENITCVNEPLRRIEGIVLEDVDGDNVGDEPMYGVKVLLMDSDHVILNETTTDSRGEFSFSKVIPGLYSLSEIQPIGFESVIDSNGGHLGSIDVNATLGDSTLNLFVISRPGEAYHGNDLNGYNRRSLHSTNDRFPGKARRRSVELTTESIDSDILSILSRSHSSSCRVQEIIVFENFEDYNDDQDLIDAGWSDAYLDVSQRGQIFTKFLGRYGQFPVERNKKPAIVYSVPSHAEYLIVEFDFYEIDSWR